MRRVVEAIAPARMGSGFRWMLASQWMTNLGDGIALAAGPLLIASQTRNPTLVAMATLLQRVPWMLFGLYAGWVADRVDRRRLVIVANIARTAVLVVLSAFILTDQVNVTVVLICMFALGAAETFVDTAADTLLPMLVRRGDLGIGNARLTFGRRALNELVGPPFGALLIAAGLALPFVIEAVAVAFGAILIARIRLEQAEPPAESAGVVTDVIEGARWLWANPPIRTLTLTVVLFNITFGAMWPMLVLYSIERLELGEVGFGLLLSASAIGGLLGAMSYGLLERNVSLANLMRVGLTIETFTHLGLALSTTPVISMLIIGVFGAQTSVWGTTATAIRQRAVPQEMQGRVGSVYMVGLFGGLVAGGAIGAVISGIWGVLAPFWFGFVGSAILLVAIWNELGNIAHADAATQA